MSVQLYNVSATVASRRSFGRRNDDDVQSILVAAESTSLSRVVALLTYPFQQRHADPPGSGAGLMRRLVQPIVVILVIARLNSQQTKLRLQLPMACVPPPKLIWATSAMGGLHGLV